jgi:hypothetical protein
VRVQQENNLLASFYLFAEYKVLQQGAAYQTLTTRFFPTQDRTLPAGYQGYSAPLKGMVYDSGVSGALVMNSISGGGFSAPLTRASGAIIDYVNSRVILPTSLGTNLALTGTASFTEFRTYLPNESEEYILTQGKYFVNPSFYSPLTASGAQPGTYVTPAIFINQIAASNDAFQLGGLVNSKSTITVTAICESNFQMNALFSIFRDLRYQYFPMMNTVSDPLNQWGDVKGGAGTGYNYLNYVSIYGQPGNLVYIENVTTSKVTDKVRINPQQFAGIIDLEVSFVRQAPLNSNIFV